MKKILVLTCMALGMMSCEKDPDLGQLDTNMVVYTDYDSKTDFGKFQTYFLPDSILEAGSHHATYWKDENAQKIIAAVEAEMNSRGYRRITDPAQKADADLGVQLSYIAQQVNVTTGWWGGWWDYGFWGQLAGDGNGGLVRWRQRRGRKGPVARGMVRPLIRLPILFRL